MADLTDPRQLLERLRADLAFYDPRNASARYDRIADEFYTKTGLWPPGRSRPAAMGPDPRPDEAHRQWLTFCDTWHERWFDERYAEIDRALAAPAQPPQGQPVLPVCSLCSEPAACIDPDNGPLCIAHYTEPSQPPPKPSQGRAACSICGKPAACIGRYEDKSHPVAYACDSCCGHGNEDGWCVPLDRIPDEIKRLLKRLDQIEDSQPPPQPERVCDTCGETKEGGEFCSNAFHIAPPPRPATTPEPEQEQEKRVRANRAEAETLRTVLTGYEQLMAERNNLAADLATLRAELEQAQREFDLLVEANHATVTERDAARAELAKVQAERANEMRGHSILRNVVHGHSVTDACTGEETCWCEDHKANANDPWSLPATAAAKKLHSDLAAERQRREQVEAERDAAIEKLAKAKALLDLSWEREVDSALAPTTPSADLATERQRREAAEQSLAILREQRDYHADASNDRLRQANDLSERITAIADEAFGPFPVQSPDESLTAIENGIAKLRRDFEEQYEGRIKAELEHDAAVAERDAATAREAAMRSLLVECFEELTVVVEEMDHLTAGSFTDRILSMWGKKHGEKKEPLRTRVDAALSPTAGQSYRERVRDEERARCVEVLRRSERFLLTAIDDMPLPSSKRAMMQARLLDVRAYIAALTADTNPSPAPVRTAREDEEVKRG